MRVGIIGAGMISEVHGPLILKQPDTNIVGIVDKDLQKAKSLANLLKVNHVFQDAEAMLDSQKPDIVHILVPPQLHPELSIMAINKGCHVIVEKPMALTVADAERMIEASKKNNKCLCVDHNAVFDDVFQRAIKMVGTGIIGDVVSVEAHEVYDVSRNPAVTEDGAENKHWFYKMNGGPLQDMFPHPASVILEFVPEIKEILCTGLNRGIFPQPWHDELRVVVKSERIIGYMHISASERPDICSLTIKGTKGVIHADGYNFIMTVRKLSTLPRKISRGFDGFNLAFQHFRGMVSIVIKTATGRLDTTCGIENFITRLYNSINTGGEPPVSLEAGLRVVELMNKIWPEPVKGGNQ